MIFKFFFGKTAKNGFSNLSVHFSVFFFNFLSSSFQITVINKRMKTMLLCRSFSFSWKTCNLSSFCLVESDAILFAFIFSTSSEDTSSRLSRIIWFDLPSFFAHNFPPKTLHNPYSLSQMLRRLTMKIWLTEI